MIMTNKLLPVALVAALIGGSVGAFMMHSNSVSAETEPAKLVNSRNPDYQFAQYQAGVSGREQMVSSGFNSYEEQNAYKTGFADGFRSCQGGASGSQFSASRAPVYTQPRYYSQPRVYSQPRIVSRNTRRTAGRSYSSSPTAYSNYQQPRNRSFWSKHRDKLTVAMGAGGGAALGALFGGKKGAAIGGLAGGGGSALYTYKLRKRNRRY